MRLSTISICWRWVFSWHLQNLWTRTYVSYAKQFFLTNGKDGRLLAVLLFCLKSLQNLCKFKVSMCQYWSWPSRCLEGRKEWLTWTSSDEYSRLPPEGITQSTRRCKSALCQRAAPLPVLYDPAQLPRSTWMSPRMEASIIKLGVNTGDRGSREPEPVMQNRCLSQNTCRIYWQVHGEKVTKSLYNWQKSNQNIWIYQSNCPKSFR